MFVDCHRNFRNGVEFWEISRLFHLMPATTLRSVFPKFRNMRLIVLPNRPALLVRDGLLSTRSAPTLYTTSSLFLPAIIAYLLYLPYKANPNRTLADINDGHWGKVYHAWIAQIV